ncbi:hypothetical protein [Kallotenue papyrolyticum]|uniref:hypothetical protein n=1 Tax=Kallotenue papyrolyticum TaxID=1325125 RepID=UPI0004BB8D3C|nr:hypothetical protein [Kallotenue papyrolyticum]
MPKIIRRVVSIALTLTLVLSAAAFTSKRVNAQGQNNTAAPGIWQSSINIQNPNSTIANVSIKFYDANGTLVRTHGPTQIAADGALSIFVPAQVTGLNAGQYSAVVESDVPVKASVNTASTNSTVQPWTAFGYEGADSTQAGTTLYFPGLYKNYYNFFSEIVIQNAGSTATTVTATFYDQRTGSQIGSPINLGQIGPNASKTFPMQSLAQLPSGNQNGLFGAIVTSSGGVPIVGIANIWRTAPVNGTSSYNAVTGGSTTLYVPALYRNYYGFGSALTIQAVGGPAQGTITYSNGATETFSLAENASKEFYQPANADLPSGNTDGVFSARVTATSGQIVGLVSLSVPEGRRGGTPVGDFASYNVPAQASSTVNIPNLMSDFYGYFSAVTVQNTGSQATNVTITYANGQSRTFNNVPPNGTVNIIHLDNTGDPLPNRTTTSAKVTSSNGQPLVAVIQHNTTTNVSGYDPSKVPSDYLIALTGSAQ